MNIISGISRNLELSVIPDDGVRPTSIRARKALFDSLGDFSKAVVLDLFSGSGALVSRQKSTNPEIRSRKGLYPRYCSSAFAEVTMICRDTRLSM